MVDRIVDYMNSTSNLYPKMHDVEILLHTMQFEAPMSQGELEGSSTFTSQERLSQKEVLSMMKSARIRLRRIKAIEGEYCESGAQGSDKSSASKHFQIPSQTLQHIKEYVEKNAPQYHHSHVTLLCDELTPKVEIPREALYDAIYNHITTLARRSITSQQRKLIQEYVSSHPPTHMGTSNVPALCDELHAHPGLTNIPRDLLRGLVHSTLSQIARRKVTSQQRRLIKQHIDLSSHRSNISLLCTELEHITNLPRAAIHPLIRSHTRNLSRQLVSKEDRLILKAHVDESEHPNDISVLCKELISKHIEVPRDLLFCIVQEYSNKLARKHLSRDQRRIIREYVKEHKDNGESGSTAQMCDHLHQKIDAPRDVLRSIVLHWSRYYSGGTCENIGKNNNERGLAT